MQNKVIVAIFTICSVMAVILAAIILAEPVPGSGGIPHPEFPGMMTGGDGAARLAEIGMLAFAFQCLLLLLIVALAALGVADNHQTTRLYVWLFLTYLFTLFVWWQMYFGHQQFLATGETTYFMGFPVATAWQIFGTWFGAIPLIVLYVAGFKTYIHSDDDERAYQQLLTDYNAT